MRTGTLSRGVFLLRAVLVPAAFLTAFLLTDMARGTARAPEAPGADGVRFLMLGDSSLDAPDAGEPATFETIVKKRLGQADSRVRFVHDSPTPAALDRHRPSAVLIFIHSRDLLSTALDLDDELGTDRWTAMTGTVGAIVERCVRRRIPAAVVFMPNRVHYDPEYGGKWARGTALERELEKWSSDRKIPYLNLTPYFRAAVIAGAPRLLYHELAAAVTLTWLSFRGFFGGAGL